jgi:hypothetical protein
LVTQLGTAEFQRNISRYLPDDTPTCLDIQLVTLQYVTLHNPFHEATNVGIGCKAVVRDLSDVGAELRARTVLINNSKTYCCSSQLPFNSYRNTLRRLFVITTQHIAVCFTPNATRYVTVSIVTDNALFETG